MLPTSGPRIAGLHYYFGNKGRFRPDIILMVTRPGLRPRGVVFEVKNSGVKGYLQRGYQEALLYRYEYADHLIHWPKAVLVCAEDNVTRPVSRKHDVVAVNWSRWVWHVDIWAERDRKLDAARKVRAARRAADRNHAA